MAVTATGSSGGPFNPAILFLGALMMLLLGVNLGKLLAGQDGGRVAATPSAVGTLVPPGGEHRGTARLSTNGDRPTETPKADRRLPPQSHSDADEVEPWAVLSERLLQPLRVHGRDGKVRPDAGKWYGDAREAMPSGLSKREADQWKRFPGPPNAFWSATRDIALQDPRGLVFGGGHGGLGNQLWAAAGVIAVALESGRLPVLSCGSCYRHEASHTAARLRDHVIHVPHRWPSVPR